MKRWTFTAPEITQIEQQHDQIDFLALVYARISWGNAPATWAQCDALLTQQWALALKYEMHNIDAKRLFIQALFYKPGGDNHPDGMACLTCASSARFRASGFLAWSQKHNSKDTNNGV
ncbi:hypothetical protein PCNPT3_08380 [Psychromonas sp. CNPT3]|uniref:hypothetical protein n=1 Tax=Psychromonas sp. CNPT3 TaxID=314282 RepID=UPI00006E85EF|nr:hypothetical protein [Psychromonas sp. CNPT3]AGH81614.1 hypothetical protein PCNPT3_08380 [Psychromonas sp. CNPT3]